MTVTTAREKSAVPARHRAEHRTSHRKHIRGNPWWTLAAVSIGVIMVGLDASVVAIANPHIAADLHASLSDLQWITNAYMLALAALLVFGGKLGDRFGRRKVFFIGVVGFAAASIGIGLAGTVAGVIALRTLQGVFGALLMPATLAIIRSTFPPEKLNTAVGIWGAASGVSIAAGPIVGGLLVEHVNWESVFYINAPIAVAAVLIGALAIAESRSGQTHRMDVPGIATLSGGLFLVVFGLDQGADLGLAGQPDPRHHPGRTRDAGGVRRDRTAHRGAAAADAPVRQPVTVDRHRRRRHQFLRAVRHVVLHDPLPAERAGHEPGRGRRADAAAVGGADGHRPAERFPHREVRAAPGDGRRAGRCRGRTGVAEHSARRFRLRRALAGVPAAGCRHRPGAHRQFGCHRRQRTAWTTPVSPAACRAPRCSWAGCSARRSSVRSCPAGWARCSSANSPAPGCPPRWPGNCTPPKSLWPKV